MKLLTAIMENTRPYRLWQATHAERKLDPLRRHNDLRAARRVLDVGCGPGINTALFPEADYLGLDWNERYVQYARRRYGRNYLATDLRSYEAPSGARFDFILVNSFFHHIDLASSADILSRLHTLLTEDGHIHVVDIVLPEKAGLPRLMARLDRGEHPRPLEEWRKLFSEFFEPVVFEPYPVPILGISLWRMVYFKGRRKA